MTHGKVYKKLTNADIKMESKLFFVCSMALFLLAPILMSMSASAVGADPGTCLINLSCESAKNVSLSYGEGLNKTQNICIYFFYGKNCAHCARIEPLVTGLAQKYKEVELKPFEVYFDANNKKLFDDFVQRYGIHNPGVPAIFIGDRALIGEVAIRNNLEESVLYFKKNGPICPETYIKVEATPHEVSPTTNIKLTIPALVAAAAIDSINPCAFAVLIFLLVYLSALGARHRILKVGITYIIAIFVVYFLSGLGLFTIIQTTHLTRIVYFCAAVIAIAAGLVNVKDFFWYGKGFTLAIPESKKPLLQKYIQQATVPAAVVLGILVSMVELPCTGGVYLAILGLLSSKMTMLQGIPYLFLYNVIFVLPLLIILFAIYRGLPPEAAEKWRLEKRRWMKLTIGLMMIALGVIMLLGWI